MVLGLQADLDYLLILAVLCHQKVPKDQDFPMVLVGQEDQVILEVLVVHQYLANQVGQVLLLDPVNPVYQLILVVLLDQLILVGLQFQADLQGLSSPCFQVGPHLRAIQDFLCLQKDLGVQTVLVNLVNLVIQMLLELQDHPKILQDPKDQWGLPDRLVLLDLCLLYCQMDQTVLCLPVIQLSLDCLCLLEVPMVQLDPMNLQILVDQGFQ